MGSNPTDFIFPLFSVKNKKKRTCASVRAGDVNVNDSLLLNTTVEHGKGRAPETSVTKSVIVNWRTRKHLVYWLHR